MPDYHCGSLDRLRLTLRPIAPVAMSRWNGERFDFSPRKLLSPRAWFRAIASRHNWTCWFQLSRGWNGRCYCPVGWYLRAELRLAGFGLFAWLSRYDGPVPCPCDEWLAELEPEELTPAGSSDA